MNGTNVLSIPMYNNGFLTATGYRQGSGYNTKICWGTEVLASSPDIISSMTNAYYGVRLYSPKYHEWMTPQLRIEILDAIKEMSLLIDPRLLTDRNEGLVKNITTLGMHWSLDNKLKINISPDIDNPQKVIEEFRNTFFKSDKLVVNVKLASPFKGDYKDDLLEAILAPDGKKGTHQLGIAELFLPVEEFGKEWISRACSNLTKCQIEPKRVESVVGTFRQVVVDELNKQLNPIKTGNVVPPADFVLQGKGYKLEMTGNSISLYGENININAPKLDISNK